MWGDIDLHLDPEAVATLQENADNHTHVTEVEHTPKEGWDDELVDDLDIDSNDRTEDILSEHHFVNDDQTQMERPEFTNISAEPAHINPKIENYTPSILAKFDSETKISKNGTFGHENDSYDHGPETPVALSSPIIELVSPKDLNAGEISLKFPPTRYEAVTKTGTSSGTFPKITNLSCSSGRRVG